MQNRYPIFIPTKNRWKTPLTIRAFDRIGADYRIVIEEQQFREYSKIVPKERILILPHRDKGLTVTRNWIWDYAQEQGYKRFWTFDDNISEFYRLNRNIKWRCYSPTFLAVIEDWVERYENIPIAGMEYELFVPRKGKTDPFRLNTRVYSNMLILTQAKNPGGEFYRNECFYNDDTDLCLRVLKDGWCTVLFQAFLANKVASMSMKGGMTDYYEKTNKRLEFAQELVDKHPDVAKVVWKWNRWHHEVDYSGFQKNKLIRKEGLEISGGINNYGMVLQSL